jgi:hypothetical protein
LESLEATECENCKRLGRDVEEVTRQRDEEHRKTLEAESQLPEEKEQLTHDLHQAAANYSNLSWEMVKLSDSNCQLKIQHHRMRAKVDEMSE